MFYSDLRNNGVAMPLARKDDLEKRIKELRSLEESLEHSGERSFSVFDEIKFRIALSTTAWYHGIVKGLPEHTLLKLPKELSEMLGQYYLVSHQVDRFFRATRDERDDSIRAYLGMRRKVISVIRSIRKGLLLDANKGMREVVSVLKSQIQRSGGEYPKGEFQVYWGRYVPTYEYFSGFFLLSFPDHYDPRFESDYSSALEQSFGLEDSALDSAIKGKLNVATGQVGEWQSFMEGFVAKASTRAVPRRINI